jgi:hypothetical protein
VKLDPGACLWPILKLTYVVAPSVPNKRNAVFSREGHLADDKPWLVRRGVGINLGFHTSHRRFFVKRFAIPISEESKKAV